LDLRREMKEEAEEICIIKRFIIALVIKYYWDDKIKED
jgi:hypothetical protein